MRGYFGIGIYNVKYRCNVGTLLRSAYQLGAAYCFVIGMRYKRQSSDTTKSYRHVPLYQYTSWDDFASNRPFDCPIIAVEMGGTMLPGFSHPERCMYLLGAEDGGIPSHILERCQGIVTIPSVRSASFNVAVAGAIVMHDRMSKTMTAAEAA